MADFSFEELYRTMGFYQYPFAVHTAENEISDQEKLFIRPIHYGPIFAVYATGASMFLIGERGVGKTALTYDLTRVAERQGALPVTVDNFSDMKLTNNSIELYHIVAQGIVARIFEQLNNNRSLLFAFNEHERILLSYLRQQFFRPISRAGLSRAIDNLQLRRWQRILRAVWQCIRFPFNLVATMAANFVGSAVSTSLGHDHLVPDVQLSEVKKIFPALPFKADNTFYDVKCNLHLVQQIAAIVKKLGKSRTVVILDKLDEDHRLQGDAERVANFLRVLVSDHNLLLSRDLQIVICLWAVPFRILERMGIRPQKINNEKLIWERNDLETALNTRIRYYSRGKVIGWRALFDSGVAEEVLDELFRVANGNPRNLWQIFDLIFREHHRHAAKGKKLTTAAVDRALTDFVKSFRYYENYPSRRVRARARTPEIYTCIQELVKLDNASFTRDELAARAGLTANMATFHLQEMENIGLIVPDSERSGQAAYRIADPKVEYALSRKLEPTRAL